VEGSATMKAKEGVLDRLNTILTNDLTAINQYFLQAEMIDNWGYDRLHHKIYEISIDEMKDAKRIIQHILYLEGLPNMQRLGPVRAGETALEHLQLDLELEQQNVTTLTEAIAHCAQVGDFTTRGILEDMVREEEEHIDWLETQLETARQIGTENYLAQQIKED
jgi:bacterioferritin